MKVGCHAVLFKEKIATETEKILEGLKSTGFEGVEIGSRFFPPENAAELKKQMDAHHLSMSGMHVGIPIQEWIEYYPSAEAKIRRVISCVKHFPDKNIILSGSPVTEEMDLVTAAKGINRAAKICKEEGTMLNFHNHAWEFVNDGKWFYRLLEHAPDLFFAFDLGWVQKGGFEPIKVLELAKKRVHYVHLRDAKPEDKGWDFCDIGQGFYDLKAIIAKLIEMNVDWTIVEYETGEESFDRYKKAKVYIDGLITQINEGHANKEEGN